MTAKIFTNDLPDNLDLGSEIAIDTEAMGLKFKRDRLCLVQIADEKGNIYILQIKKNQNEAPNLSKILSDKNVLKIFHFARFDVGVLFKSLNVMTQSIYCTKIASKIARTYTQNHGLKALVKEVLGVDISKEQQSSYWGKDQLSEEQILYASNDVLYLHKIKDYLNNILVREDRLRVFERTCDFLAIRCELDNLGWEDQDIFSH
jgi:ribonuclease D